MELFIYAMAPYFKAFFHFAIIIQLLFFVIYLTGIRTRHFVPKALFIAFLLLKVIPELGDFIYFFEEMKFYLAERIPHFFFFQESFDFVWPPVLFLYIVSKVNPSFSPKPAQILHFIPFMGMMSLSGWKMAQTESLVMTELICYTGVWSESEFFWIAMMQYGLFFAYAGMAWRSVYIYTGQIKIGEANFQWLKLLVGGLAAWKFILMADFLLWLFAGASDQLLVVMHITSEIIFLTIMMIYVFKGIRNSKVLVDVPRFRKLSIASSETKDPQTVLKALSHFMETSRIYLNPEVRMKDLAEGFGLSIHEFSQLINEHLGKNFQDFINHYRIEESKKLLANYSNTEKNISQILYEVGFNSKSVFNTAFKKNTQMTPRAYREQKLNQLHSA